MINTIYLTSVINTFLVMLSCNFFKDNLFKLITKLIVSNLFLLQNLLIVYFQGVEKRMDRNILDVLTGYTIIKEQQIGTFPFHCENTMKLVSSGESRYKAQ